MPTTRDLGFRAILGAALVGYLSLFGCSSGLGPADREHRTEKPVGATTSADAIYKTCTNTPVQFNDQGGGSMPGPVTLIPLFGTPSGVSVFSYTQDQVTSFYEVLKSSQYWSWVMTDYGAPALSDVGPSALSLPFNSNNVQESDLKSALEAAIESNSIPSAPNPLYIIHLPLGMMVTNNKGQPSCQGTNGWGGYHGWQQKVALPPYTYFFVFIPDCTNDFTDITENESHEIAEATTDYKSGGWKDLYQPANCGGEIGDLCANEKTSISSGGNTTVVQKLWSNVVAAGPIHSSLNGCVTYDTLDTIPGAKANAMPVLGLALSAYAGSDGSRHINYVDPLSRVHELSNETGSWVDTDLFTAAFGAGPASLSALSLSLAAYWGGDGSQHVDWIEMNGDVHEFSKSPGGNWQDLGLLENIALLGGNPVPAASTSSLYAYWGDDGSQHVDYIDVNGDVTEIFTPSGPPSWSVNDLTQISAGAQNGHGITAVQGSGLDGYWGSDSSQHVNFVGTDGDVHELFIAPGAAWVDNDLTQLSGGTSPQALHTALDGYWGTDGSQHVNFIGDDSHVHELYIGPLTNFSWTDFDLFALSGVPAEAVGVLPGSETPLNGYWAGDDSQHVDYIDARKHVHELYIAPGGTWTNKDLAADGTIDLPDSASGIVGLNGGRVASPVVPGTGHQDLYYAATTMSAQPRRILHELDTP